MKLILNIGLDVQGTTEIAAHIAREIVAANEFLVTTWTTVQSDTEPTLVCEVIPLSTSPLLILQQLRQIAVDLKQDCIAVYRTENEGGALIGPNAKAWGKFNPYFFFNLDGQRLAQENTQCQPSNAPA